MDVNWNYYCILLVWLLGLVVSVWVWQAAM